MKRAFYLILLIMIGACKGPDKKMLEVSIFETSASGNKLKKVTGTFEGAADIKMRLNPDQTFQTVTGFGGAFTESTSYLLNQMSAERRNEILNAYFSKEGANYSLTRTHINSCDFSLSQYSYAPQPGDTPLTQFSIKEDMDDLVPTILAAKAISEEGFKIISSPWTAPPWMKDNNSWLGGKLLPEYYDTWALFFSKYIAAYKKEGIDIWGVTVENEPHGNGDQWESMKYTPEEMTSFVKNHLGPKLAAEGQGEVKIFGYDQNRGGLDEWKDVMYANEENARYYAGMAIHWYESTYEVFPEALQRVHKMAPDKHIIETEGCIEDPPPHWKKDDWFWQKEATDWGWRWAPPEQKYLHPKYVPVYRYARDIIGCLNNWVDGWVDWNMVLDTKGGPNWAENYCTAPIHVNPLTDDVYYTPIYYTMAHFSKYIRPGAKVIDMDFAAENLLATAAKNPDGSIAVVVLNPAEEARRYSLTIGGLSRAVEISPQALQTLVIPPFK